MNIPIGKNKRIKGTERCWELQRIRTRKGQEVWESYKWFSTFRQALDEAVHSEIRTHPASTIAEAIEAVSDLIRQFSKLIPPGYRKDR